MASDNDKRYERRLAIFAVAAAFVAVIPAGVQALYSKWSYDLSATPPGSNVRLNGSSALELGPKSLEALRSSPLQGTQAASDLIDGRIDRSKIRPASEPLPSRVVEVRPIQRKRRQEPVHVAEQQREEANAPAVASPPPVQRSAFSSAAID